MRSWLTLVTAVLLFGVFGCGDAADDSGGVSESTVSIDDCVADLMADDASTRRAACGAIGMAVLNSRRAAARSIPLLVRALHDDDPGVRTASADALFAIGDAAVENATLFVVEGSERGEAMKFEDMRVTLGPGRLRPHDVTPALSHRRPDVRVAGTFGLLEFVRPGHDFCSSGLIVELLLERLDDPAEGPRRMAATVLGIGGLVTAADRVGRTPSEFEALFAEFRGSAIRRFQELTRSEDETTRRLAGVLVGCLSPSEAPAADAAEVRRLVEELESLRRGENEEDTRAARNRREAQRRVLDQLASCGEAGAPALAEVRRLMRSEDPGLVNAAAAAVLRIVSPTDPNSAAALVEAYEASPLARRDAVAGMARLGPAAASSVPFLIRVLEGSDRGDYESGEIAQNVTALGPNYVDPRISKRSAAFALARIGAPAAAARDALNALADAQDERLRYVVRLALRRIGK